MLRNVLVSVAALAGMLLPVVAEGEVPWSKPLPAEADEGLPAAMKGMLKGVAAV